MMLLDLVKHAAGQEAAIDELIDTGDRFTPDNFWGGFWNSVWGKDFASFQGEVRVERDADPVEDPSTPPDSVPSTAPVVVVPDTLPVPLGAPSRQILLRSEYEEAEAAALEANDLLLDAFLVTGQPRIGPSPFRSIARMV